MATIAKLAAQGALLKYELDDNDPRQPERVLYITPELVVWIEELPRQPISRGHRGETSTAPYRQVYARLREYVAGDRIYYDDCRLVMPQKKGVWKFHTLDTRIFGWFHQPRTFIAVAGGLARDLHGAGRTDAKRDHVLKFINELQLDEPKIDHTRVIHDLL